MNPATALAAFGARLRRLLSTGCDCTHDCDQGRACHNRTRIDTDAMQTAHTVNAMRRQIARAIVRKSAGDEVAEARRVQAFARALLDEVRVERNKMKGGDK